MRLNSPPQRPSSPLVHKPQFLNNDLPVRASIPTAHRTSPQNWLLMSFGLLLFGVVTSVTVGSLGRTGAAVSYQAKSGLRVPTSALLQVSNSCGRLQSRSIFVNHLPATRTFTYVTLSSPADMAHCTPQQLIGRLGAPYQLRPAVRFSKIQPLRTTWAYRGAKPAPRHPVALHIPTPLPPQPPAPVLVTPPPQPSLEDLLGVSCPSTTEVNIVAHQDDDLLFINPEISQALQSGQCVRTIYLTAGDDGRARYYWQSRQHGAEAAYSAMLGATQNWVVQSVALGGNGTVTVAKPAANSRVTLVFFNLPDGNLDGSGFNGMGNQSLTKLQNGVIGSITANDRSASYTNVSLIRALSLLLHEFAPARINTQADDNGQDIADHADHLAAGHLAALARDAYVHGYAVRTLPQLGYYMGYPIRGMEPNLAEGDAALKSAAFFAYAVYDSQVCKSAAICESEQSAYSLYLTRQYTADH